MSIRSSKDQLEKLPLDKLKLETAKNAWVALKYYFDGGGNGSEAKVACVVIGTLAKEEQSRNNARSLDLIEKRLLLGNKRIKA